MNSAEPSRRVAFAFLTVAALAAWGGTLASSVWTRDDRWLILENPLLQARAIKPLLFGGYVQAVMSDSAPIHQWRPVLSMSFLAQIAVTGFSQPPLRTANLLLHILVAFLLYEVLRKRGLSSRGALAGAILWAVLPAHSEVTAYLTSRSEMLAAASVLGSWLLLGAPAQPSARRLAAGAGIYLLGALSKEHTLLFPLFLALADWTFSGRRPWDADRRKVYLALGAAAAFVVAGRMILLPGIAVGGHPYFPPSTTWLTRLLTLSKFWVMHYARPALTGTGMCIEYARPLIPDSGPRDVTAWLSLAGLLALALAAARALLRRSAWGFWLLAPCIFLLPTSHLIMELDTIGAQRFLYIPCFALAWLIAKGWEKGTKQVPVLTAVLSGLLILFYTVRARAEVHVWADEIRLYTATLACNPVSAKTRTALAVPLLKAGRQEEGFALLRSALEADGNHYPAVYNLALNAHQRGDKRLAREVLARARRLMPEAPDSLSLEGLLAEEDGNWAEAAKAYSAVASLRPQDGAARWNLARSLAHLGRPREAAQQLDKFLELAPHDPDAPAGRRWRETLPR